MSTKAATKRLTVELPVCPEEDCETVGKIPAAAYTGKSYCTGKKDNRHPRKPMEVRKFKEVR